MKLIRPLVALLSLSCVLLACDGGKKQAQNLAHLPDFMTHKGDIYTLTQGDTQFEISAKVAGRISSLKVQGQELLLTDDATHNLIWGNLLWSSPQSEWNWPPVETLDSKPYEVSVADDRLIFTSKIDAQTGYQFVKSYGLNTQKHCLSIRYSIYNHGAVEKSVAAWEITRLPTAGLAFFPQGNTEVTNSIFYPMPVEHIGDITWINYNPNLIRDNHHKMLTDGKEGWMAYANHNRLLVKEFADVPVELMVPGEGEIEIFANKEKTLWEIAEQSVMYNLAPGEHLEWEVLWHTRTIPGDIPVAVGSAPLLDYARGVVKGQH